MVVMMQHIRHVARRSGLHRLSLGRTSFDCRSRPIDRGIPAFAWPLQLQHRFFVEISEKKPGAVRRFYTDVSVQPSADTGKWHVTLDGRKLKTPKGSALDLPTKALAEAIAAEWDAQTENLAPDDMVMMTLACTAVDLTGPARDALVERVIPYLETDTICFPDDEEAVSGLSLPGSGDLLKMQKDEWDPLRTWFEQHFGVKVAIAEGLMAPKHPESTIATVKEALHQYDDWELTCVEQATYHAKSLITGVALVEKEGATAEDALRWSNLEEFFQIERWGLVEGEHDDSHALSLQWFNACKNFVQLRRMAE
eukprot:gnl/MRDRNA2_/MRDRNA2_95593_c0_seq1.p1 gnl/MRDRNA2_/MRDRNA2_95593_c0~~gnl/MRDRNA2_/MRDRNA2_95593_c0_seq1.p1  ORF type:complete len:310 (+),score=75.42 gnl/MRDRNA2_/MRDRNA2_95593_c0_seq1:50-979(+)